MTDAPRSLSGIVTLTNRLGGYELRHYFAYHWEIGEGAVIAKDAASRMLMFAPIASFEGFVAQTDMVRRVPGDGAYVFAEEDLRGVLDLDVDRTDELQREFEAANPLPVPPTPPKPWWRRILRR